MSCCARQMGPVLEAMEEVVLGLTRALDGRVYVALGRGLWDFTAKDIFDYVESLQEGQEHQARCTHPCAACMHAAHALP